MIASLQSSTRSKLVATAAKVAVASKQQQQRSFTKSISPSALNNHHIYDYTTTNKSLPLFDFFAQSKPQQSYKLGHGAAGFAKKRSNTETSVITCSSWSSESAQVGEDAYFRRSDAIGVADGIGGWQQTAGKKFLWLHLCGDHPCCYYSSMSNRINFYINHFTFTRFKLGFIF